MKAIIPLKALAEAVRSVSRVVPSRTTRDILKNVKLTCSGGTTTISATDSEMSASVFVRCTETPQSGSVLLPCDKLSKILSSQVEDGMVSISCPSGIAEITAARSKFKLQTSEAADFPPDPAFPESDYFSMKAEDLRRILNRTYFCCNPHSEKAAFSGVCFEFLADKVVACATNDKKLSVDSASYTKSGEPELGGRPILIQKAAIALASMLKTGVADISIGEGRFLVRCEDFVFSGGLAAGRFPTWQRVAERTTDRSFSVLPSILATSLKQAAITTAEETCAIRFRFEGGTLTLSGSASDLGESAIEIPVSFEGVYEKRYDPMFLIEAARFVSGDGPMEMCMDDNGAIITFDDGWKYAFAEIHVE